MASFWDIQNQNKLYSYGLVLLILPMIFILAYFVGFMFDGGQFIAPLALIISIFYSVGGYFYGDKVVLAVTGARRADEKEQIFLHNTIEGLAIASGLPKPALYVIDDPSPNAFATGRDPKHASIAVTTGLMKIMNRQELEGVLAHEMSHIRNYDSRFMTATIVLVGMVAILADLIGRMLWFGHSGRDENRGGGNGLLLILGLFLVIFGPIMANLVKLAISRKREYLADASAAQLTRNPEGLASALEKLMKAPPMQRVDESVAPLFISNPQGVKKSFANNISNLFSTHPPLEERVKILRSM